jgi:hypothetical protein
MKFSHHSYTFADSAKPFVELQDRESLVRYCQNYLEHHLVFEPGALKVELYNQQDTLSGLEESYMVTIDGFGAIGFTDSPC